jgi:thioredoxin family protein
MFRHRNELPVEGELSGLDGSGTADYQRMYQLIRQPQPIDDRVFEIAFPDAGVEAFVFTFG